MSTASSSPCTSVYRVKPDRSTNANDAQPGLPGDGRIVQHIGHGATVAIRCGRLCTHRRTITLWTPSPPSPTGPSRAAAVVQPDGSIERWGDTTEPFALASVTKLLTAMTVLIAHEEGTLDLDEPIGPGDSTTTDLLAHTAGFAPDTLDQLAPPRTRRIY